MSFWKGVGKLNDLIDVAASAPNDSEALVWVAANQRWEPVAGGGGGQSNTASNINVGGVGVFEQKISADLQFRGINAADSKISVALDAGNYEIDIGLGTVNLDDLSDVVITTVAGNEILQYDSGTSTWINQTLAEAGISAVGHTHATTDITSGTFADARIAESNVTQHVAAIDHDSLLNFVANEHIDHTSVTLTAGSGLTGGGDISANRSFAVDINGLTEDLTPSAGNDYVMSYDASAGGLKKVLMSNLPGGGGGSSTLDGLTDTNITSVTTGEVLKWDGTDWINNTLAEAGISAVGHTHTLSDITDAGTLAGLNAVASLDDITDVTITTIASGELLKWNGSAWINNTLAEAGISAVGHTHTLSDITDAGTLAGLNAVASLDDITDVTITTIASGELLKWNGSAWINNTLAEAGISAVGHTHTLSDITDAGTLAGLNAVASLDDITDVTITTIASGELLKWNGSAWINNTLAEAGISAVGHTHTLSDITDAGTLAGLNAIAALNDITDVTITTIASGELLKWNGSAWINNTLAEAGISAVGHTHATTDITSGTFADARIAESNVTQHVAAIDHDSLLNFVANEHIDWTSASSNFTTTGTVDLNGSSWFKVPVSATPTLDADGKVALDTTVADFSHGVLKYYGGEEMAIVALPIDELTTPTNAHVIAYNSTNDEFELVAQTGGGASALDDLSDVVIASAAAGDMLLHDGTDWDNKSINDLTADASPDGAADYVMTWDASASDVKKVLLDNLPGGSAVTGDAGAPVMLNNAGTEIAFSGQDYFYLEDDFLYYRTSASVYFPWADGGQGTGSQNYVSADTPTGGELGVYDLITGTSTTGNAQLFKDQHDQIQIGIGTTIFEALIKFPTLADATDDYIVVLGFHDSAVYSTSLTEGVYFEYNRSNSTNWRGACTTSSTTTRTSGTDVAVGTGYHHVKFEINAVGTSITFYVDGTNIGSVSTNIPSYVSGPSFFIRKTAGTNSRTFKIDWTKMYIEFTSSRW